ncbi:MAG: glycosyltransferase family 2 protein [Terracidiphilus sp.]
MKVAIVSPTYNEAENVPTLALQVDRALSGIDYELLIADDDSPDRTWAVAEELGARSPQIRVLRRTADRGLSPAVMEGFLASSGEYVGVIDADLQHDPKILPEMIEALDAGAEIVVGSRYAEGGGMGEWRGIRRFQSWFATRLAQSFVGVELTDPMSGYFMLRRADFDRIHRQLDVRGFKILLEIIARLGPSSVVEIPYTFRERAVGESKMSSKVVLQFLAQIWRLSSVSRYKSVRLIKFALVGGFGTVVNLCAFLVLAWLLGVLDWRISALATLLVNVTNYIFGNAWAFVDRRRSGLSLAKKYLSYFASSSIGLTASTLTFAGAQQAFERFWHVRESFAQAVATQLFAILIGSVLNFEISTQLNRRRSGETDSHAQPPSTPLQNSPISAEEDKNHAPMLPKNLTT